MSVSLFVLLLVFITFIGAFFWSLAIASSDEEDDDD